MIGVTIAAAAVTAAALSGHYGKGQWTHVEWLRLTPGMTQHHAQRLCACTGIGPDSTPRVVYYNNTTSGFVEVVYRHRADAWRASNTWWCTKPPGMGGCTRSPRFT